MIIAEKAYYFQGIMPTPVIEQDSVISCIIENRMENTYTMYCTVYHYV